VEVERFYTIGVALLIGVAVVVFPTLLFVPAPYGRHARAGWGPTVSSRLAWSVMESPSVVLFAWIYLRGDSAWTPVALVLAAAWLLHYVQRTFLFPLRMRATGQRKPLATVAMAFGFNCLNATLNALAISQLAAHDVGWLRDPRFLVGLALFLGGFALNVHSDAVLRRLRGPGETGYRIPRGGLFRYVTSPNYLAEIVEWIGWALASWSGAGLAFALFTFANLVPRARSHHRWYHERFPDYPRERRALVPFLY